MQQIQINTVLIYISSDFTQGQEKFISLIKQE